MIIHRKSLTLNWFTCRTVVSFLNALQIKTLFWKKFPTARNWGLTATQFHILSLFSSTWGKSPLSLMLVKINYKQILKNSWSPQTSAWLKTQLRVSDSIWKLERWWSNQAVTTLSLERLSSTVLHPYSTNSPTFQLKMTSTKQSQSLKELTCKIFTIPKMWTRKIIQ